jgi:hypothetical protein
MRHPHINRGAQGANSPPERIQITKRHLEVKENNDKMSYQLLASSKANISFSWRAFAERSFP